MQRGMRKNTNRILFPNMMISQSLIQSVMKGIIIILCLYIAIKCVNLITGDRAKEVSSQVISDTSKMLAKEIVEKTGVKYTNIIPGEKLQSETLSNVTAFPTSFFLNDKGEVIKTVMGATTKEDWVKIADELLESIK